MFDVISSIFFRAPDVFGISYFCMNPDGTSPRSAVDSMGISKVLSPAAITNSGFSFSLSRSTAAPLFRVCGTTYTFSPLEKTSTYFVSRDVFKSFTTVSGSLHFVKINSFSMYRSSNFLRGSRSNSSMARFISSLLSDTRCRES